MPLESHYLQPTGNSQDEGEGVVSTSRQGVDSDSVSVSSTVEDMELLVESRNLVCPPDIAAKDLYLAFNSTLKI